MNVQSADNAKDIAAVSAIVREETAAFLQRDFDRWARCFVHDSRTQEVSYGSDRGVLVHRGWDQVAAAMRTIMSDNPEKETVFPAHKDIEISVQGNMAWATFQSKCRVNPGDVYQVPDSHQMRILERHDGRWRIVYLSFAMLRITTAPECIVQVDETAQVVWASNHTLAALKDFEGLTISAGRLRATDRRYGEAFHKAVSRAADLRHLFDASYISRSGNNFVCPCLLGEAEDGGTLYCTVFVRDGLVNVMFNNSELVEAKIRAAKELFALSSTQCRLAHEITNGRGLPEVARVLGISVNTARTHLSRVFEKTGVTSQPALVRLLLSLNSLPG